MFEEEPKFYIEQNWGVFWGRFINNAFHKHYAIQLSFAEEMPVQVMTTDGHKHIYDCTLVKSNVTHQLVCNGRHLILLFSPITSMGQFLSQLSADDVILLKHSIAEEVQLLLSQLVRRQIDFKKFIELIKIRLEQFNGACLTQRHLVDERIERALSYLEANKNRVVPLAEIAKENFLSPSRFLHLFKDVLGITYRRAQLWIKICHSFAYLQKHSITDTAYQYGFADSAHYSKVFKQNFGFSPKFLKTALREEIPK
ncbi:AraC family transcriptional regulator [Aureispira sp. CCB-QB1]|uniref:helix-turn-helix transcriptional regulator n=1 Tax=Aureispira sp. CCB-QB1 TaxID=1313421 RepID=UPI0006962DDF|nr:AraC family transcriptional regulator [Aureispira sp. CCB-QB1]